MQVVQFAFEKEQLKNKKLIREKLTQLDEILTTGCYIFTTKSFFGCYDIKSVFLARVQILRIQKQNKNLGFGFFKQNFESIG